MSLSRIPTFQPKAFSTARILAVLLLLAAALPAMAQPGKVAGTVRDRATSQPAAGVSILLLETSTFSKLGPLNTAADGSYSFLSITPGKYVLLAFREGRELHNSGVFEVAPDATVTQDFVVTLPEIRPGKVEGVVRSTEYDPLGGYSVSLRESNGKATPNPVITAADGKFVFASVQPGSYTLAVAKDGAEVRKSNTFSVVAGETVAQSIEIEIPKPVVPSHVTGRVHRPDDSPWSNLRVEIRDAASGAQPVAAVNTAADGTFSFGVVPPGRYQLRVVNGGRVVQETTAFQLDAAADVTRSIEIAPPPSRLAGKITRPDLTPWNAVRVELLASSPGAAPMITTSGADGSYAFTNLTAGVYTVSVYQGNKLLRRSSPVQLAEGDNRALDLQVELPKPATPPNMGRVIGTVTGADGKPLAGANVDLMLANGTVLKTITSESDGSFAFEAVAPGTYMLTGEDESGGYSGTQSSSFSVEAGKEQNIKLVLPKL